MKQRKPKAPSFLRLLREVPEQPSSAPSFWDLLREPEDDSTDPEEPQPPWKPEPPPNCALKFDPQSVYWAMRNLPVSEAPKHFLVCGATGSGKTIAIQLFLQSIAPRFRIARSNRANTPSS